MTLTSIKRIGRLVENFLAECKKQYLMVIIDDHVNITQVWVSENYYTENIDIILTPPDQNWGVTLSVSEDIFDAYGDSVVMDLIKSRAIVVPKTSVAKYLFGVEN